MEDIDAKRKEFFEQPILFVRSYVGSLFGYCFYLSLGLPRTRKDDRCMSNYLRYLAGDDKNLPRPYHCRRCHAFGAFLDSDRVVCL